MRRLLLAALAFLLASHVASAEPIAVHVASANAVLDQSTLQPVLNIRLTEDAAAMFEEITAANVGKVMELRIDGEVVMAPMIREAIKGGSLQISGEVTFVEYKALAARLSAGTAKVEVEVSSE